MTGDASGAAAVVRRAAGAFGELVLRRAADGHHEVISDGTFLMDTRDGRSECGLVVQALLAHEGAAGRGRHHGGPDRELHVLVGGLGVGFTLGAALASSLVGAVTVVEVEQAIVELVREGVGARTGADLDDDRVRVVVGDLVRLLRRGQLPRADVVCIDVDNGPGWTLSDANRWLYGEEGLTSLRGVLRPGGVLAVWSAHEDDSFATRLASVVGPVATHRYTVARGEPDVVWVAGLSPR